jgi:uncharacterized protein (TIGR02996 family)
MSHCQSFLDAIAAQPADRNLRLIYADWLEERGDLGGELILIEEEMRRLPVWADRFWELKPRRNELRERVDSSWRETLGYGLDVPPTFAHGIPDGWRERWRLIREFTERWYGVPMPDVGGRRDKVQVLEDRRQHPLPAALQEWVAFRHDGQEHFRLLNRSFDESTFALRQWEGELEIEFKPLPPRNWYVRASDMGSSLETPVCGHPDPPVFRDGQMTPRLTALALRWMTVSTRGKCGGFTHSVEQPERLVGHLTRSFSIVCPCPESSRPTDTFFEAENIFVILRRGQDGLKNEYCDVIVEIGRLVRLESIPAFLLDLLPTASHRHGIFALPSDPPDDSPF